MTILVSVKKDVSVLILIVREFQPVFIQTLKIEN